MRFATYRIDEQIAKGLDRKVWLPSGGSLIIDRTEAMTVVDVNTGKFTGSGGNLEETVTKNNLEAAEEIVRQLRLRDIGGIIVVDFIDMVLESNRDLVLRRLVECLGRDRTRHQVAEVTSLGLVQMTRKRIGTGLLEAFSENCDACQGRGVILRDVPVEPKKSDDDSRAGRSPQRQGVAAVAGTTAAAVERGPEDSAVAEGRRGDGPARDPGADRDAESVRAREGRAEQPSRSRPRSPRDRAGRDRRDLGARRGPEPTTAEPDEPGRGAGAERQPSGRPATAEPAPRRPRAGAVEARAWTASPRAPSQAEPEKPKVVTRTRRRSASRPAGPPTAAPAGDSEPATPPAHRARGGAGRQRAGRRAGGHRAGGARHRRRRAGHRRVADGGGARADQEEGVPQALTGQPGPARCFAGRAQHPYY